MALFILDTDICIYWLKGDGNVELAIGRHGLGNIAISVITECELYYGAYRSSRKEHNLSVVEELKSRVRTIQTTSQTARLYGRLKADLGKKGQPVDDADLLIASIAISSGATLVTNNTAHFGKIPGLKIDNWK